MQLMDLVNQSNFDGMRELRVKFISNAFDQVLQRFSLSESLLTFESHLLSRNLENVIIGILLKGILFECFI